MLTQTCLFILIPIPDALVYGRSWLQIFHHWRHKQEDVHSQGQRFRLLVFIHVFSGQLLPLFSISSVHSITFVNAVLFFSKPNVFVFLFLL